MMHQLLLIVDNWESLDYYEAKLKSRFRIECAAFGNEGIRLAHELLPDLILIDLTLEDMSPNEAINFLRSNPRTQSIPLLVILDPSAQETILENETLSRLSRPYRFEDLIHRLKALEGNRS
jgi:CheY-like chemotaxis protein